MISHVPTRFDDFCDWVIAAFRKRRAAKQQKKRAPELVVVAPPATPPIDEGEVVKDWVKAYRERRGRDPAVLDVAKAFGLSKTTAWRRMQA